MLKVTYKRNVQTVNKKKLYEIMNTLHVSLVCISHMNEIRVIVSLCSSFGLHCLSLYSIAVFFLHIFFFVAAFFRYFHLTCFVCLRICVAIAISIIKNKCMLCAMYNPQCACFLCYIWQKMLCMFV